MSGTTRHICQVCGKEFIGRGNQKNCTVRCGWKKSSKKYYHKKKELRNEKNINEKESAEKGS